MRFVRDTRTLIGAILVIGLVAAVFSFVCTDGVHLAFGGTLSPACAVMSHANTALAATIAGSGSTIASTLALLVFGLGLMAWRPVLATSRAVSRAAPGLGSDPLNGRLRI
ncbi:MAG TPA: hypothetical protein VF902_05665 [Coriobacteriia bacterium]